MKSSEPRRRRRRGPANDESSAESEMEISTSTQIPENFAGDSSTDLNLDVSSDSDSTLTSEPNYASNNELESAIISNGVLDSSFDKLEEPKSESKEELANSENDQESSQSSSNKPTLADEYLEESDNIVSNVRASNDPRIKPAPIKEVSTHTKQSPLFPDKEALPIEKEESTSSRAKNDPRVKTAG